MNSYVTDQTPTDGQFIVFVVFVGILLAFWIACKIETLIEKIKEKRNIN